MYDFTDSDEDDSPYGCQARPLSTMSADRVYSMLASWNLVFDGTSKTLPINQFLFRVEALTNTTLQGDFGLLCTYVHTLFRGRAADWYWDYHQSVGRIEWTSFREALRHEFKDSLDDWDILELMRDRMQGPSEDFDSYYKAVRSLANRLENSLTEDKLVELLRRGLRPDVQRQLLYFPASTVRELRNLVQQSEILEERLSSRLSHQLHSYSAESEEGVDIKSISGNPQSEIHDRDLDLVCWNCRQIGHLFEDCWEDPKVFCFGCGRPNTRKPVCPNCRVPEPSPSHQGVPTLDARDCAGVATTSSTVTPKVTVLKRSDNLNMTYPDLTPPPIVSRKPMLSVLRPLHVRLQQYQAARERIFGVAEVATKKPKRSTLRLRHYWMRIMRNRRLYYSAILTSRPINDIRPYADVTVLGERVSGLIDTGATVSCLASDFARKIINDGRYKWERLRIDLRTADGTSHSTVGRVSADITFRDRTESMSFLLIPSLTQNLYLGADFVRKFDLAPDLFVPSICSIENVENVNQHQLTTHQRARLDAVIGSFPSFESEGLGRTSLTTHVIDVGGNKPIKQRHFSVSPAIEKLLYEEIDRMLALGVIEESQSAWSSPVTLVVKPGKVRLCLDARKVNSVTVKDAYPLPLIEGIFSRLPKARFITSLDLKDAFWQIPLDEASKDKTAFTVPGRPLYQFVTMPFGLCNAPQTMQRLMDKVIPAHLRHQVFVYLDDLLLITETFDQHLLLLSEVALCMRRAGLTLNIRKSKFVMKEVRYLGHIIGNGTICTDPDKVHAIKDFPRPKTVRQLRRFLGMCGWYQRFVPNYASLTAPLTDMLQKKRQFCWSEEAISAFDALKTSLSSAPVLHSPDFSKPFAIHCDASQHGIGAVLMQKTEEGHEVPIAYMSKKLTQPQRNYTVTEQECLAAVEAVRKFRAYVEGTTFEVVTDHASLKWLMNQSDLHGRLARWALKLQGFSFIIKHRKGSQHLVPDSLSRMYSPAEVDALERSGNNADVDFNSPHFRSANYLQLIERIRENSNKLPDLQVCDGLVYKRTNHASGDEMQEQQAWKLWIPEELTMEVITRAHDHPLSAHGGVGKTLGRLRLWFYWPKMVSQVKDYIRNCETCKTSKASNQTLQPLMGKALISDRVFQRLYIDLIGPYPRSRGGNIGAIVVLDSLSKFSFVEPIKRFTANVLTEYLEKRIFHVFGIPESITSDNGVQFKSVAFNDLLNQYGIQHIYTALYSPQANASERVNRSLLAAIRAYIGPDQRDWDNKLSSINCALRSAKHVSIGTSPYHVVFGQSMVTHGSTYALLRRLNALPDATLEICSQDKLAILRAEVQGRILQARETQERGYNLRSRAREFQVGDIVYKRLFNLSSAAKRYNAKLDQKFVKAKVIGRVGTVQYELEDMEGRNLGIAHAKDLKA
ncbi:unnamed protein product [Hermetia illucens]|uniref:RNA-directed DNA polymerase n=1 Tax=Hermetia illucens TaxID=343691 RepID=A0A7R8V1K6_HERIL|nr:unnamed protein product [Hermetia illucens]